MPRTARLNYPGGAFHIIARCSEGRFFFKGNAERASYLGRLGDALERTDTELLGYCLMSNHVHLLAIQGQEPLSRLLKPLHTGFALWLNRRRRGGKVAGPIFAGRPKCILVDRDEYLLELIRYIHNNPVRAQLCRRADESSWSSHRAYIGREEAPDWLNVGYVLQQFAKGPAVAQKKLDAFVRSADDKTRQPELSGDGGSLAIAAAREAFGDAWRVSDPILGSAQFVKRVIKDIDSGQKAIEGGRLPGRRVAGGAPMLRDVVAAAASLLELEPWQFDHRPKARKCVLARQLIVWVWVRHFGGSQAEVSRELKVSSSVVSRWYGNAVELAPEIDEMGDALVATLRGRRQSPLDQVTRSSKLGYRIGVEL